MEMWLRRREAASAGLSEALYSVYSGLYSEAVVSSVASAVVLVEVGQFREAVQYVQKAAKALYEAAREVFEKVKVTVQRLVELFVEAVARALAWIDEHKACLFLMAAVAAGAIALATALDIWGLIELDKLAYAASLSPFVPAGVKEYSREEVFNILKNESDPYERFKEIAREANRGKVKLAEPWESLRKLIMPKPSEEERLMHGGGAKLYSKYREDENYKRALFYAAFALEKAFGVYRTALRKYAEGLKEAVQRVKVGEGPFKRVRYMLDLGRLTQLAEEEDKAFEDALRILRERLNEYAVKYGLRDLLDVNEGKARELSNAEQKELSNFSGANFGTKAYAAIMAYREYALGRRGAFGAAAKHWLEAGGSVWLLYYAPITAYVKAERAEVVRPAAVEELVAEALRRLFLKPGADHLHRFVEELAKGGKLALELVEEKTKEKTESYMFKLFRLEEGGGLVDLGIKLRIAKVGESIVYELKFDDVERWRGFFEQELEAAVKAAVEVGGRLPVEDRLPYMLGWVDSDVAISEGRLKMGTSHLWQLAETQALFDWSYIAVLGVNLTLEGPKPQFDVYTSLDKLDEAIRRSAEGGWLKMLGIKAGSWEELKRWVADHWGEVIDAVKKRLKDVKVGSGFDLVKALEELESLKSKLDDDKTAREVVAPALLLIQAESLGVNETTLRYFGAVISGAVGGDGYVSAAMRRVELASGKRTVTRLWAAALAAYGIKAEVKGAGRGFDVVSSGGDAARLAGLYFLYGSPLLEGRDDRLKSHKLVEAVELGAEGLEIRWERLREIKNGAAADLIISVGGVAVKYNVYLRKDAIVLDFQSTDRSRVELAARLLRLAGVTAEVKKKEEGDRDVWRIEATTDMLAAAREELRKVLAEIVREAIKRGLVNTNTAERWLKKLEKGLTLMEGWPEFEVGLTNGALKVRYRSTNPDSIKQTAQQLRELGLKEGVHFSVKMPEGDKEGYVSILKEGLAYLARLSVRGKDEQQRRLAASLVEHILRRAEWVSGDVHEKVEKIIEEGKARGSLKLEGFEKEVEVDGKTYVVKVIGGGAKLEKSESGKLLLRIKITAEVDGVRREYVITFDRDRTSNEAKGYAYARGREADAERFSALIKALTGKEPWIQRMKDGRIKIGCGRGHLDGFMRYAELADAIEKWLEETGR
jgi:hypothetical protein